MPPNRWTAPARGSRAGQSHNSWRRWRLNLFRRRRQPRRRIALRPRVRGRRVGSRRFSFGAGSPFPAPRRGRAARGRHRAWQRNRATQSQNRARGPRRCGHADGGIFPGKRMSYEREFQRDHLRARAWGVEDRIANVTREITPAERDAMERAQARFDSVGAHTGQRASAPILGETSLEYRKRLFAPLAAAHEQFPTPASEVSTVRVSQLIENIVYHGRDRSGETKSRTARSRRYRSAMPPAGWSPDFTATRWPGCSDLPRPARSAPLTATPR